MLGTMTLFFTEENALSVFRGVVRGGEKVAQTLEIRTKKDTVQLVLDGHEIHDVVSYQLEEALISCLF